MKQNLNDEIFELKNQGFTKDFIAEKLNLSVRQVEIGLAMKKKELNCYNESHVEEKYLLNDLFFENVNPRTILDLHCGIKRFWSKYSSETVQVISNDICEDKNANPDRGMTADAASLLHMCYICGGKFDLVDIDPYGSPADCIKNGINVTEKGLIITFGDVNQQKRFPNRSKYYFKEKYGISIPHQEITIDTIVNYVIDLSNNKFKLWTLREWRKCARIYFIRADI